MLGRPLGRGGAGEVDVDDASPVVRQVYEDEQDLEHHGGPGEEVHGDEGLDVIGQEGSPGLRWRSPRADHVLGDRRLRDLDASF